MLNSLLNYPFIFYQKKVYKSRTAAKCFIRQPTINGVVNHPRAGMRLFKKDFHTTIDNRVLNSVRAMQHMLDMVINTKIPYDLAHKQPFVCFRN